jgi:hypothetical protein
MIRVTIIRQGSDERARSRSSLSGPDHDRPRRAERHRARQQPRLGHTRARRRGRGGRNHPRRQQLDQRHLRQRHARPRTRQRRARRRHRDRRVHPALRDHPRRRSRRRRRSTATTRRGGGEDMYRDRTRRIRRASARSPSEFEEPPTCCPSVHEPQPEATPQDRLPPARRHALHQPAAARRARGPGTRRAGPPGQDPSPRRADWPAPRARGSARGSARPDVRDLAPTAPCRRPACAGAFDRCVQRPWPRRARLRNARPAAGPVRPHRGRPVLPRARRPPAPTVVGVDRARGRRPRPLTDLLAEEAVSEIFIHGADLDRGPPRRRARAPPDPLLLRPRARAGAPPNDRPRPRRAPPGRRRRHNCPPASPCTPSASPLVHGGPVVLLSPPQPGPARSPTSSPRASSAATPPTSSRTPRSPAARTCSCAPPPGLDSGAWVAALAAAVPDGQRVVVVHRGMSRAR